jgi:2-methylaconitate cis-trans-isomerase PrpF
VSARQLRIPAVYMRGATSKEIFFRAQDLPSDPGQRDHILLRAIGSADPYGKQVEGLGNGTSIDADPLNTRLGHPSGILSVVPRSCARATSGLSGARS